MLCVVVVIILHVDLTYSQHIFPEHIRSQSSAIRKSEIMANVMPEVRQLSKELLCRQQEILDAIKGGFVLTCPDGWVYHDDNCYLFTQHRGTWQKMRESCVARGGYLADIRSREFVKEELRKIHQDESPELRYYYLGGTDSVSEGQWVWVRTGQNVSFTDWQRGEPSNSNGNEDCIILNGERLSAWNDAPCAEEYYAICEKRVEYKQFP